jgi:peptidoglycan-associated lipoprotein
MLWGNSMRSKLRKLSCAFLILLSFDGCKKQVVTSQPPQVQPAALPPAPAPAITLRANPLLVDRSQSVALQWEAKNASTVRIEPELGTVQTQGSRLVNPASSVTYTATATGAGGTASDSVRVTVRIPPPPTPSSANPTPKPVNVTDLFKQNVQTVYFDYDDSEIRADQIPRLNAAASWLKARREIKFTIQGHCDERGSEEYNLGLGDRRANRVKEYLLQQGVEGSRIGIISYGEDRPGCREATEDCYQRNRRVEFVLGPTT